MKFTQIRKIDNIDELDNYLNPKTTPVGLLKTMYEKTKNLSIIKLETESNYGTMLYDADRQKFMIFSDAKYDNFFVNDDKHVHDIFKSLAKDFQNIDKSLIQNNRIKELKEFISENEMVGHYRISIDVPDLVVSTEVDKGLTVVDDIGCGLAGTLFDDDLIHKEKDTLSLKGFEDIILTAKGELIGRITEIQEIEAKSQLSLEHQQIVDFMETHKEQGYEIGMTSAVGYSSVSVDNFIDAVNEYKDGDHVAFSVYDKEGQLVDVEAALQEEQEQENEQWQDIPLAR